MKRYCLAALLVTSLLATAAAQESLGKLAAAPMADGVIAPGEYGFSAVKSGAGIHLGLSADGSTIYAAIDAPTKGWVSLGLGSLKMGGASIFMAEDKAGSPVFSEQLGAGHGHSDAKTQLVLAQAVKTAEGRTVFEFSLPAGGFIASGKLDLIYAFGGANMSAYHFPFNRGSLSVPVAP
jgi:hypothetical protein